jgi:hypothetical protein
MLSPRLATVVAGVQVAWSLWLYTFLTPQPITPAQPAIWPGTPFTSMINASTAGLLAVALVLCAAILWWIAVPDTSASTEPVHGSSAKHRFTASAAAKSGSRGPATRPVSAIAIRTAAVCSTEQPPAKAELRSTSGRQSGA